MIFSGVWMLAPGSDDLEKRKSSDGDHLIEEVALKPNSSSSSSSDKNPPPLIAITSGNQNGSPTLPISHSAHDVPRTHSSSFSIYQEPLVVDPPSAEPTFFGKAPAPHTASASATAI
jgi:hypothetical protein